MLDSVKADLERELEEIRAAGLWKDERVLASPQGPVVRLADGREVLVFCANNYLGLSSHPEVIAAAHRALDERGFGLSSVRFICGTQDLHQTARAPDRGVPGHRGRDPLRRLLRRQRRRVRAAAGRAGRDHLGRAQPRFDHRRRPAVQGAALALRARRHGRPRALPARGRRAQGLPAQADRHRRRVQHGRSRRRPEGDLRAGRPLIRRW